jgi:hypothetical protein
MQNRKGQPDFCNAVIIYFAQNIYFVQNATVSQPTSVTLTGALPKVESIIFPPV